MEEKNNTQNSNTQNKLNYEQLEQVAHQLSEQNRQLHNKLQDAYISNMSKRIDYLFKVMEYQHMFSSSFVDNCAKEIEECLTPELDNTEENGTEEQ